MSKCFKCGHPDTHHHRQERSYRNSKGDYKYYSTIEWCTHPRCRCPKYLRKTSLDHVKEMKGNWSVDMIKRNEELRKNMEPAIKVDKDFHELFCKVLKEETSRNCDCEGTTSEIR